MIPTNVIPMPSVNKSEHMLCCPICGKNDGYMNAGAQHWAICREHKLKWLIGEHVFDGWENQTIAQFEATLILLKHYREISPVLVQQTARNIN